MYRCSAESGVAVVCEYDQIRFMSLRAIPPPWSDSLIVTSCPKRPRTDPVSGGAPP